MEENQTVALEEVVTAVPDKKTRNVKKKKEPDDEVVEEKTTSGRQHEFGKRLGKEIVIEVRKDFWENISAMIQQCFTKYTTFNTEQLDEATEYIKTLSGKNLPVRDFEGIAREYILGVRRAEQKYDYNKREVVRTMVPLVKSKIFRHPETKVIFERDNVETLVDSLAKVCYGIDPFNEKNIFICSLK
jgi:hypothetical protein